MQVFAWDTVDNMMVLHNVMYSSDPYTRDDKGTAPSIALVFRFAIKVMMVP